MEVLIWDGMSMTNKYAFDTIDRLFKDLCRNSKPLDGKEINVSGDFRQTLSIVSWWPSSNSRIFRKIL